MYGSLKKRTAVALLASSALLVAPLAAAPVAASDLTFPAGVACDFELAVDVGDGGPQNYRAFTDDAGQVLWWISAGRGNDLTFTNVSTGATLSLDATGAVSKAVNYPDGSSKLTMIGQNVLILFPSDVPAGPSTTLQVGRVVVDIDAGGNFAFDENLHVIERFSLFDADTLLYQFEIDDPTAYARPWKGELTMARTADRIYEFACHEANYSLDNMLRGARATERKPR